MKDKEFVPTSGCIGAIGIRINTGIYVYSSRQNLGQEYLLERFGGGFREFHRIFTEIQAGKRLRGREILHEIVLGRRFFLRIQGKRRSGALTGFALLVVLFEVALYLCWRRYCRRL